jgi:hypothetical protein
MSDSLEKSKRSKKPITERTQFSLINFYFPNRIKVPILKEFDKLARESPVMIELAKTRYQKRVRSIVMRRLLLDYVFRKSKNEDIKNMIFEYLQQEKKTYDNIVEKWKEKYHN